MGSYTSDLLMLWHYHRCTKIQLLLSRYVSVSELPWTVLMAVLNHETFGMLILGHSKNTAVHSWAGKPHHSRGSYPLVERNVYFFCYSSPLPHRISFGSCNQATGHIWVRLTKHTIFIELECQSEHTSIQPATNSLALFWIWGFKKVHQKSIS